LFGSGIRIFTRYEPSRKLELVGIIEESVVIHFRINLINNNDGTSTGLWKLTFTALNESENVIVDSMMNYLHVRGKANLQIIHLHF
jgi:hypothetical protein